MCGTACARSGSTALMSGGTVSLSRRAGTKRSVSSPSKLKGLDGERFAAIAGDLAAAEEMFALKLLADAARLAQYRLPPGRRQTRSRARPRELSVQLDHRRHRPGRRDPAHRHRPAPRGAGVQCPHPQARAPGAGKLPIGLIGEDADLTYAYDYLGAGPETLAKIADGSHPFLKKLEGAERPMLILGQGALARRDGAAVLALAAKAAIAIGALKPDLAWNGFNVLHAAAARVAGLDLGFVPGRGGLDVDAMLDAAGNGKIEIVYLLGADEIDMERLGNAFVIYQGSHGDKRRPSRRRDPARRRLYREGRHLRQHRRPRRRWPRARCSRRAKRARTGRSSARCRPCSARRLPFDTTQQLRAKMFAAHPHLALLDLVVPADAAAIERLADAAGQARQGALRPRGRRLLSHQPDRARLRRHGEFERAHAGRSDKATGTDG